MKFIVTGKSEFKGTLPSLIIAPPEVTPYATPRQQAVIMAVDHWRKTPKLGNIEAIEAEEIHW